MARKSSPLESDAGVTAGLADGAAEGAGTELAGNQVVDLVDLPAAPSLPHRIEPIPDYPDAPPPCGGSWQRQEDGSLLPRDEETAVAAGLAWPTPAA